MALEGPANPLRMSMTGIADKATRSRKRGRNDGEDGVPCPKPDTCLTPSRHADERKGDKQGAAEHLPVLYKPGEATTFHGNSAEHLKTLGSYQPLMFNCSAPLS